MENQVSITTKKVVVVDDDVNACLCLRDILSEDGGFDYVGYCTTAGDALVNIPKLKPDLVLMDIHLPDINGIECTKRLCQLMPLLKVIMITGIYNEGTVTRSITAGAIGYLVKPISPEQCHATLQYAMAATEKSPPSTALADIPPTGRSFSPLTQREYLVMEHLAEGLLYKEIADRLKISYAVVHKLQHKIFIKLRATNRTEAIAKWHQGVKQH